MFVFVFQPKANRETLREFNERLREYCAEQPVVSLDAQSFGGNLIIQGTTADDMDVDGVPTFTATVRTINSEDNDLEEQLDGLIGQEMEKHKPEDDAEGDPNLPVKIIIAAGEKRSWAVVLCVNGIAEDDDQGGSGEDGDEPQPVGPAPAAGFQGN